MSDPNLNTPLSKSKTFRRSHSDDCYLTSSSPLQVVFLSIFPNRILNFAWKFCNKFNSHPVNFSMMPQCPLESRASASSSCSTFQPDFASLMPLPPGVTVGGTIKHDLLSTYLHDRKQTVHVRTQDSFS